MVVSECNESYCMLQCCMSLARVFRALKKIGRIGWVNKIESLVTLTLRGQPHPDIERKDDPFLTNDLSS